VFHSSHRLSERASSIFLSLAVIYFICLVKCSPFVHKISTSAASIFSGIIAKISCSWYFILLHWNIVEHWLTSQTMWGQIMCTNILDFLNCCLLCGVCAFISVASFFHACVLYVLYECPDRSQSYIYAWKLSTVCCIILKLNSADEKS